MASGTDLEGAAVWVGTQNVDGNGIVLFDPSVVERWRPGLKQGFDLFAEFISSDIGDYVLHEGIFVPVLAIDDAGYSVIVRYEHERSSIDPDVVVVNGRFPLRVESRLVIADLAVLRDWMPDVGWTEVPCHVGCYAVTIRGFRRMTSNASAVADAGYEFVLESLPALPLVTGDTGAPMRVLNWW